MIITAFVAIFFVVIRAVLPILQQLGGRGPAMIEIVGVVGAMVLSAAISAWLAICLALSVQRAKYAIAIVVVCLLIGVVESFSIATITSNTGQFDIKIVKVFLSLQIAQLIATIWPLVGLRCLGFQLVGRNPGLQ